MDDDAAYLALQARDARFDGRLFVGVSSTRIYCRPVCRVRLPLRRNCHFYPNAAQAEAAGYRPCLRCRPELAPGLASVDSSAVLALQAARWLDQSVCDGAALPLVDLARRLGVTDRHLRRIFLQAHGVAPLAYLGTQRLLLAKRLLTDTALPVTEVALQAGFGSLRRFHAAFASRYRLTPNAVRATGNRPGASANSSRDGLTLRLAYRPPYDIDDVLGFFAKRAVAGLESVHDGRLRRSLSVPARGQVAGHGSGQGPGPMINGWFEARFLPDRHELVLTLAPNLAAVLGSVLPWIRQGLDLDADPALIQPSLAGLPGPPRAGLRLPSGFDGFEAAVRVILGQQVTVAAAGTLTGRLVAALGAPVVTPWPEVTRLFPSAATLAGADAEQIGRLGIVRQRVGAIQALARAVCDGRLALHRNAPLDATLATLRALPGIGEWSAQLIALRCLAWPDAFPASDIGVLNALGHRDAKLALQQSEAWRPWRAYAVMQLWLNLET